MNPLRIAARACIATIFVKSGADSLGDPGGRAQVAGDFLEKMRGLAPLPATNEQLVQVNGAVQTVAGGMLALGIAPRLSATALSASLIPTTLGGHAFWEIDDPQQRVGQRLQFTKNLSILGGLLYIASTRT